ncbi:MAG: ZIP family metal transporter [Planctomycetota bacterium]|jgi:zinc and cadmium transporter
MTATGTLVVYCLLIAGASLLGGWLPTRIKLTHTRMELIMSFVSGLMLGVALFHMLPHGIEQLRSTHVASYWLAAGLLAMFLLIRVFHVHAHGEAGTDCSHAPHDHKHKVSWTGVVTGLTIHSLLDGIALAAAVAAGARYADPTIFFGFATFLAIMLHKPLDSLSITSVMAAGGWPVRAQRRVNFAYALAVPAGAAFFSIGLQPFGGAALAFSAGIFICIALADLLPEIQFHQHDRIKLTVALLAGVMLAYAIGLLHPHASQHTSPLIENLR